LRVDNDIERTALDALIKFIYEKKLEKCYEVKTFIKGATKLRTFTKSIPNHGPIDTKYILKELFYWQIEHPNITKNEFIELANKDFKPFLMKK